MSVSHSCAEGGHCYCYANLPDGKCECSCHKYDSEKHKQGLEKFINQATPGSWRNDTDIIKDLKAAVYSLNELHLWIEAENIGWEDAMKCWKLIETLRYMSFPEELKM